MQEHFIKPYIDPDNSLETEYNGCKVKLFFSIDNNHNVKGAVLDQIMLAFDRRITELSSVRL